MQQEPEQTDHRNDAQELTFAYLWVAIFFAAVAWYVVRHTLPTPLTNSADVLALYAAIGTFATFMLVGYQVALAMQQNRVLLRQDEILSRREILSLDFDQDGERFQHVCTDDERLSNQADFDLVLRVLNSGMKSAPNWYLNIYLPEPSPRILSSGGQAIAPSVWTVGDLVYIDGQQYRLHRYYGKHTVFPSLGVPVRFRIQLTPSNNDCYFRWQLIAENGVYPSKNRYGRLAINARLHHDYS